MQLKLKGTSPDDQEGIRFFLKMCYPFCTLNSGTKFKKLIMNINRAESSQMAALNSGEFPGLESADNFSNLVSAIANETFKNQTISSENEKIKNTVCEVQKKDQRFALAKKSYDYWVETYDHKGVSCQSALLVKWLHCEEGAEWITTYDQLVEFAIMINDGNADPAKIPSNVEYEKAMLQYAEETGSSFNVSKEAKVALAFEKFDFWMKNYSHDGNTSAADNLLEWLIADHGAELITTYEEFVEVASQANSEEYDISKMPSELEYKEAMSQYVPLQEYSMKYGV